MTVKNTIPETDKGLNGLLAAETKVITLVGKTWLRTVNTMRISKQQNLDNIFKSVNYLNLRGRAVFFDAEHWFDSYRQDPDYAFSALEAAINGGASRLVLCDTRGASTDSFIFKATRAAVDRFPNAVIGIHIHQDSETAVIGTIRGLEAGAGHAQATVNGVGERTGNANWCSLLPTQQFKYREENGIDTGLDLTKLTPFAHTVARLIGIPVPPNAPYVGYYAFAHKAGLHVSAIQKDPESYEHIPPEWVGNKRIYVFSEQGGSAHLEYMLKTHNYQLDRYDPRFKQLLNKRKTYLCFGQAQETLFLYENLEDKSRPFTVLDGSGIKEDISPNQPIAQVNVRVNGDRYYEEASGDGPINAYDIALKQALSKKYSEVNNIKLIPLTGYRVTLLDGDTSTASEVEVSITVEFEDREITSIARGPNQNRAGEAALADAYNCCIIEHRKGLDRNNDCAS